MVCITDYLDVTFDFYNYMYVKNTNFFKQLIKDFVHCFSCFGNPRKKCYIV